MDFLSVLLLHLGFVSKASKNHNFDWVLEPMYASYKSNCVYDMTYDPILMEFIDTSDDNDLVLKIPADKAKVRGREKD